jgi:hypothetical protein
MLERLCRAAEWLKLQRLVWAAIFAFALIGLGITTAASLVGILDGISSPWVLRLVTLTRAHLQLDEDLAGFLRSSFLTLIGISIPFALIVCQQRKAVISALAEGYWRNFLYHFVKASSERTDNFKLLLLPPGHLITEETDSAIQQTKKRFSEKWSVELREEFIKEVGRSAFVMYRDGQRLNVAVDMCRNLAVLGRIVRDELGRILGGTFCTSETKFAYLAERYLSHLNTEWISKRDQSETITILKGIDDPLIGEAVRLASSGTTPQGNLLR